MVMLIFVLISCSLPVVVAPSASDNARRKLVSLTAEVRQADGRRYASRDHRENTMDSVKIIKRTGSDDFVGIYHTYVKNVPRVNLAISNDLLHWTWVQELTVHASHPTIVVPIDQPQGYILAWQEELSKYLKFSFYSSWDNLKDGTAQKTFEVNRTLSRCAEGTPNIYGQPTLANIDVGFHFSDDCNGRCPSTARSIGPPESA